MKQRIVKSISAGAAAALWPLAALAAEPQPVDAASRALNAPGDLGETVLLAIGGLVALFAVASVGYLYRRERHLDWTFQRPDAPHDEHH